MNRAAQLRHAFDRGFAEVPSSAGGQFEELLAIRIGADPFALRLAQVAGLFADREIVPIPSPVPELLGIAGLRGHLAPVYDLGALLGYSATPAPRWFVLARGPMPVGLAFGVFEAHARAPESALAGADAVQLGGAMRPIIHIPSVIDTIAERARTEVRHG